LGLFQIFGDQPFELEPPCYLEKLFFRSPQLLGEADIVGSFDREITLRRNRDVVDPSKLFLFGGSAVSATHDVEECLKRMSKKVCLGFLLGEPFLEPQQLFALPAVRVIFRIKANPLWVSLTKISSDKLVSLLTEGPDTG
jgi:hypothetical protein